MKPYASSYCPSGHLHSSPRAAQECEQLRFQTRIRELGIKAEPAAKLDAPEPGVQTEAFPDFIKPR